MFNAYTLILGLFVVSGLITMAWGWRVVARGRLSLQWPAVEGEIIRSEVNSDMDDLLPQIEYRYAVNGMSYTRSIEFPADITPSRELTASYQRKYPAGARVQVFHNPLQPDIATLEPGPGKGDWLIFAFGLGAVILGMIMFVFGW